MSRWVIATLALLLSTACSSASGSGDQGPRRSAAELATIRAEAGITEPTPTERVVPPTATRSAATATRSTSEQNPGYATDPGLFQALIDPSEISTTWTLGKDVGVGSALLCGAAGVEEQFEPVGWAYGSYSAAGGEWAEQWVVRLTEPDALAAMEYVRESMTCDRETLPQPPGNDWYYDYKSLELASLGDDLYARSFTLTFQNPVYTPQVGSIVFAQKGEFIVIIMHYGFHAQPETAERMAAAAISRLDLVRDNSV